jgi:hypothetical protein
MSLRQSHTFAILELSEAAYNEIRLKLHRAGYEHAFIQQDSRPVIDMHGIAVALENKEDSPTQETKKPK